VFEKRVDDEVPNQMVMDFYRSAKFKREYKIETDEKDNN